MAFFNVEIQAIYREVYFVEAASPEDAVQKFRDGEDGDLVIDEHVADYRGPEATEMDYE